jgi:hypothetical protein
VPGSGTNNPIEGGTGGAGGAGGAGGNIVGTNLSDTIYGNGGVGGNLSIHGGSGNDSIYSANLANPSSFVDAVLFGDAGNDNLVGANAISPNYTRNVLDGSNPTLKGVGEQDTLIGGSGSENFFILGVAAGSYYLGTGNTDYAYIVNYDPNTSTIQAYGSSGDYTVVFNNGVSSLFLGTELIAKIESTNPVDPNLFMFV